MGFNSAFKGLNEKLNRS